MNTDLLKQQLRATKPWPFYLLKQASALKELAASADPEAAAILAGAVDGKHRLAGKILPILSATTRAAWIDRLCSIWAKQRQDWLGEMIRANKWMATGETSILSALKAGLQDRLPTDPQSVTSVLKALSDTDSEVRAGLFAFVLRLPDEAPSNDAVYSALVRTKSADLEQIVREQRRLPGTINEQNAWWALKSGLEAGLPTTTPVAFTILQLAGDKDPGVTSGVADYVSRLPDDAAINDAIYSALVRTKSADLERIVCEQRRLPGTINEQHAWWALKAGLEAGLPATTQIASTILQLAGDKDPGVTSGVADYVSRLPDDAVTNDAIYSALVRTKSADLKRIVSEQHRLPGTINEQNAWWILKLELTAKLAVDPQTIATVLGHLTVADESVRAGVAGYVSRLPNDASANDSIYDAWIRTQSVEIQRVITTQKRLPSSVAKETLLRLSSGDVDGYLALDDENGQIFREAWGLAAEPLRQLVVQTVTKSGSSRLIDAYTRALGSGTVDHTITLEARKTAGDEDGLLEACRSLKILDLLDQCARWAETGRLPSDPSRKRAVENAIAAWQEVGKIEFEGDPKLPDGLVDFFDAELESALDSPDPLMRLHAAVNGKGSINPQQWITSEAWPERLAARLLDPTLADTPDHVEWTSLAGGVISNAIFTTTAEGTPAEHETLLRLREANADRSDRAAVINRGLAGVLLAFQSHFQRGAITSEKDDSAEDRAAIQVGGEADAGDMEF